MRQAGVSDDSTQTHYFKDVLNEHDRYLLTSDMEFRKEERLGTTIQLINDRMADLLSFRDENSGIFKHLHGIPRVPGPQTPARQVTRITDACKTGHHPH